MILVSPLPNGTIWTVSNQNVVNLTPLTSTTKGLEIGEDGEAEVLVQFANHAIVRIRLYVQTFNDTWQVKMNRATDTGEVIWEDGSFGEH